MTLYTYIYLYPYTHVLHHVVCTYIHIYTHICTISHYTHTYTYIHTHVYYITWYTYMRAHSFNIHIYILHIHVYFITSYMSNDHFLHGTHRIDSQTLCLSNRRFAIRRMSRGVAFSVDHWKYMCVYMTATENATHVHVRVHMTTIENAWEWVWEGHDITCHTCTCVAFSVAVMYTHILTYCNTLQHSTTHCTTLQHAATRCNSLQRTVSHCNMMLLLMM